MNPDSGYNFNHDHVAGYRNVLATLSWTTNSGHYTTLDNHDKPAVSSDCSPLSTSHTKSQPKTMLIEHFINSYCATYIRIANWS